MIRIQKALPFHGKRLVELISISYTSETKITPNGFILGTPQEHLMLMNFLILTATIYTQLWDV